MEAEEDGCPPPRLHDNEPALVCVSCRCGPACGGRGLKAGGRRWRRASGAAGAALIIIKGDFGNAMHSERDRPEVEALCLSALPLAA
jgi:hypothetical protein